MVHDSLPPGHFFGQRVNAWRVGSFVLSESVYEPDAALRPHAHARAYLTLVVNGAHRETAGAIERQCVPATAVFHPQSECHANKFSPRGGRIFRLEMDDEWLTRFGARLNQPAESHRGLLSQIASRMFREFRDRDSLSPLMIEGLALEFASGAARTYERRRPPAWLRMVIEYLHECGANSIRLDDVATVAGVGAAHVNRVFRAEYGCSVGEYIRRLRVDTAARALAETRRPIAEIAIDAGFADQSHFSRVFRRITGLTPARYRQMHSR